MSKLPFPVLVFAGFFAAGIALGFGLNRQASPHRFAPTVVHSSHAASLPEAGNPFAVKSAQLAAILVECDSCREFKDLLAWVDSLDAADFPKALAQLRSAPDGNRDATLDVLIDKWMEVDPQGAISAVTEARRMDNADFGRRLIGDVYDAWSARDPEDALDDARHSLGGEEQKIALSAVLGNLARTDPVRAFQIGRKVPEGSGNNCLTPIFEAWAGQDLGAATRALVQLGPYGNQRGEAINGMASELVEDDPHRAVAWLGQLPPGELHDDALREVGRRWSANDPAAAMAWGETLPASDNKDTIVDDMALSWANRNAVGAVEQGMRLPEGKAKGSLLSWGIAQWTYDDAPAAAHWIETIRDPALQKNAFASMIGSWTDYNPVAAAHYLATMPPGEARQNCLEMVARSWSYNDPVAASAWVTALPDSPQKAASAGAVVEAWARTDLPQATAWVNQIPAGPGRDGAAKSLSAALSGKDPAAAQRWAESITDPKAQQEQLTKVFENWMRTDSAAATAAMQNSSLSVDARKEVLENQGKYDNAGFPGFH